MQGNSSDAESRPRCAEGEGEEGVEEEEEEKRGEEEGEKSSLLVPGRTRTFCSVLTCRRRKMGLIFISAAVEFPPHPSRHHYRPKLVVV